MLEVEALLREGDADATSGPLLLSRGRLHHHGRRARAGPARACASCDAQGRIVEHLGVEHISFPMWTRIAVDDAG